MATIGTLKHPETGNQLLPVTHVSAVLGLQNTLDTILSKYLPLSGGTLTGQTIITSESLGSSTISAELDALIIAPKQNRIESSYHPGIAFNAIRKWGGQDSYDNYAQAWIGTRHLDSANYETSALVFGVKPTTTDTRPVERMSIAPSGVVKMLTDYSNLEIGSVNNSFIHFISNSIPFYFNKNIHIAGDIYGGTNYNKRLAYVDEIPTSLPANGGNADTLDSYHASSFLPTGVYDYTEGCLVKTNMPASNKAMVTFKIEGNGYDKLENILTIGQFYNYYPNGIIREKVTHYGHNFGNINVFNYQNVVCIWFKQSDRFQSFLVTVTNTLTAECPNRVVSITNTAMPESGVSHLVTITPEINLRETNYAQYAVKKDGSNATGTWGIDISGKAADASKLANYYSSRPTSLEPPHLRDGSMFQFKSTSSANSTTTYPGDGHILHFNWDTPVAYNAQLYLDIDHDALKTRRQGAGVWYPWKTVAYTDSNITGKSAGTTGTLTISGKNVKTFNGSQDVTVNLADLGISSAMNYIGKTTTSLFDGSTTSTIVINGSNITAVQGDVVIDSADKKEYIWNGSKWEEFGTEGNYKVKQESVSSPSTNGEAVAFIDTIKQDENGRIEATKKSVTFPTLSGGVDTGSNKLVSSITTNGHTITALQKTLKNGTNITITDDGNNITIDAEDTTYTAATTSKDGLMSYTDKAKLDGISANANNYTLPTATNSSLGGVELGYGAISSNGSYYNLPINIANKKLYTQLTPSIINTTLGYTPANINDIPTNYVTLNGDQTITGAKTFATNILTISNPNTGDATLKFYRGGNTAWSIVDTGGNLKFNELTSNTTRLVLYESSQGGSAEFAAQVTATKFITSRGTSSQFVKGDGSLDSTTYATSASLGNYLPLTGGTISNDQWAKQLILNHNTLGESAGLRFHSNNELMGIIYVNYQHILMFHNGTTPNLEVLHSGNYNSYAPKLDGSGATGTWNININGSANSLNYETQLTTSEELDNFLSANKLRITTVKNLPTGTLFANDGILLSMAWDYTQFGAQICIDDNNSDHGMVIRHRQHYNWSDWKHFAYTSDIPTKLSDLTDDVVSGKYLPLSGGQLNNNIIEIFSINSTSANQYTALGFYKNSTRCGGITISSIQPTWRNLFLYNSDFSGVAEILNDKNYTAFINETNFPGLNKVGTVTSIKVGTTSYFPDSGVVSLPAYPTSLPANGGDADTVDGKHASDFLQIYKDLIDDYTQCISLPRIKLSYIVEQGDFGSLTIPTYISNRSDYFYQTELRFGINDGLKYRNLSHIVTGEFKYLLDSLNYTNYVNTINFPGLNKTGTVTSVGLSVPTGFSVSSSPITTSGTLGITFASGYSLPTTAKQNNWDTVYNWYTSMTATDTDALVNKWGEIVDFLDSVAEGTDITDEFVTRKTEQTITGAKTFAGEVKAPKFVTTNGTSSQFVKGDGSLDNTVYATAAQLSALSSGLKLSASCNPSVIYKSVATNVTITASVSDNSGSITASSITINTPTVVTKTNVSSASSTFSLNTTNNSSTYTISAVSSGLPLAATATVYARYPVYCGMGTSYTAVATDSNKLSARTSALGTYTKTATADGQSFFLLVPSDVSAPSSSGFTMGGAPVGISTTSRSINGISYTEFKTNATYNSGTSLTIKAN